MGRRLGLAAALRVSRASFKRNLQMPAVDVLPPVQHTLRTELLLTEALAPDATRIPDALASRGVKPNPERRWVQEHDVARCSLQGGGARVQLHRGARELSSLRADIVETSSWWDSSRLDEHSHVIEIVMASTDVSAPKLGLLLVRLTGAILDLAESKGVEVLGVVVNGARVLPADFVKAHAEHKPPVEVLVGMHPGTPGGDYVVRTSGLPDLGISNLEIAESDREIGSDYYTLQHLSRQLIELGKMPEDGATVGDPGNRVVVTYTANAGGEPVYRLSYAADQGEKELPALETVCCPECGETVDVQVIRFAFIPMMIKCPACGAGPVALLDEMTDQIGGGKVTLAIETTDLVALARLLAEHDPRFETVIEASDFLRESYRNGRVEVRMLRAFATVLKKDADESYPQVRVSCDEALGVLDNCGSQLFHSSPSDTAMQDAIAAARAGVPEFIARLESPQPGDEAFGIKFPFRDGDMVEHIWVSHVRRESDEFVGLVSAEPHNVTTVHAGKEVRLPIAEISDWAFSHGEALHGNYTTRLILGTLPKPMRDALQARLVPLASGGN